MMDFEKIISSDLSLRINAYLRIVDIININEPFVTRDEVKDSFVRFALIVSSVDEDLSDEEVKLINELFGFSYDYEHLSELLPSKEERDKFFNTIPPKMLSFSMNIDKKIGIDSKSSESVAMMYYYLMLDLLKTCISADRKIDLREETLFNEYCFMMKTYIEEQ